VERVEQRVAQFLGLFVGERLRTDLHGGRATAADHYHRFGCLAQRLAEHVLDLLGADRAVLARDRHRHLGAALEVDTEGETAQQDAREGNRHDQATDRVPELATPDDLESACAGVQAHEEAVPGRVGRCGFEVGCLDHVGVGHVG
jgi:hypothetical protein